MLFGHSHKNAPALQWRFIGSYFMPKTVRKFSYVAAEVVIFIIIKDGRRCRYWHSTSLVAILMLKLPTYIFSYT